MGFMMFQELFFIFFPGFHLSGTVKEPANGLFPEQEKVYKVSVNFDR